MRLRLVSAGVLALGLLFAPAADVQACTCAFLGGTVDVAQQAIADADVAFIGTVMDSRPGPDDPDAFAPTVLYAFAVERATVPVAEVIEVRSLDDGGGGSCGFTFGQGETWFVTTYRHDGVLHTGLCNGNTKLETLADGEQEQISAMLTAEPVATPAAPDGISWLPIGGIVVSVLAVGATMAIAFRRDRLR